MQQFEFVYVHCVGPFHSSSQQSRGYLSRWAMLLLVSTYYYYIGRWHMTSYMAYIAKSRCLFWMTETGKSGDFQIYIGGDMKQDSGCVFQS